MGSLHKDNILYIFLLIFISLCILKGIVMQPDSGTYINFAPTRQPLYPLFINFFKIIDPSLWSTVFFQLSFIAIASKFLTNCLSRSFALPLWVKFATLLVILFPYYSQSSFGNSVMSEGLAYPLFILFAAYFYLLMTEETKNNLLKLCVVTFLLIATRKQFIFIVPVFCVVFLFPSRDFKRNWHQVSKNIFYFSLLLV